MLPALAKIKELVQRGDFRQAKASLEKCIQSNPNNVSFYNLLGQVNQSLECVDEAYQAFEKSLNVQPNQRVGLASMAQLQYDRGEFEKAIGLWEKLIVMFPHDSRYFVLLGACYEAQGEIDQALKYFLEGFNKGVRGFDFVNSLVSVLKDKKYFLEAEECYKTFLLADSKNVIMWFGLAELHHRQKKFQLAIPIYQKILQENPDTIAVYNNLGNALSDSGRYKEAFECFFKLLEKEPNNFDAHLNLSNCYNQIGCLQEAEQAIRKALKLQPENYACYYNLANILQKAGSMGESEAAYEKAIKLQPDYAPSYNNLGNVHKAFGRCTQAIEAFNKALELNPNNTDVYNNLGSAYFNSGLLDESEYYYQKALYIDPKNLNAFSNFIYQQLYKSNFCDEDIYKYHLEWYRKATTYNKYQAVGRSGILDSNIEKIKVGFVSGDFIQHSVAFFSESFFEVYNKNRFEIYCYSNNANEDNVSHRIKNYVDYWRLIVGASDQAVINQIRQDGIHILVDLSGHTSSNRLGVFLGKPSPIQVSWLGYPNTTGISQIDYRITDNIADPKGVADNLHVEQLVRLPGVFLCYNGDSNIEASLVPPVQKTKKITFTSFNHTPKITTQVLETWAKVLLAVPNSRLKLKCKGLSDTNISKRIMSVLNCCGVRSSRVDLIAHIRGYYDHMALYNEADIALDTFPYSGTTTSFEAMWMGIPVVTVDMGNHRSRVSKSILSQVGLGGLAARSTDEYVDIAKKLAQDEDGLLDIRATLRGRMQDSLLCDKKAFAVNMESAFEMMVKRSIT